MKEYRNIARFHRISKAQWYTREDGTILKYTVDFHTDPASTKPYLSTKVAGKAEARRFCKFHNATPWNF